MEPIFVKEDSMRRTLLAGGLATVLFVVGATGVGADPFLCPVIGEGALDAPGLNGPSQNSVGALPSGDGTIVPGNNQAGAKANDNAYNEFGGPSATNVPGTPGFTPIWNP
jgi:hypothetical protein